MIQRALVVHAGNHRLDGLAVAEGQHTDLGAGQKLLNNDMVAGGTELFVQHDLLDAVSSLLLALADQHALAERQTVCLDDHRVLALGPDVIHDLFRIIECLIPGGGDAVLLH